MKRASADADTGAATLKTIDTNKRFTRSRAAGATAALNCSNLKENIDIPTAPRGGKGTERGRGRSHGRGARHVVLPKGTVLLEAEAMEQLSPEPASQPLGTPLQSELQPLPQSMSQFRSQTTSPLPPGTARPPFISAAAMASQSNAGRRRLIASRIHDVPKPVQAAFDGDQVLSQVPCLPSIQGAELPDEEDHFVEHNEMSEYTQRIKFPSTPGPAENPRLSLSHPDYGLPPSLVQNLSKLGINSIYPWQAACLLGKGHLTHEKNLVYSAPTGGGKSLVADVLMLRKVLHSDQKAILVLPYVALVQEKMKWLRKVCESLEKVEYANENERSWQDDRAKRKHHGAVRVTGFFGAARSRGSWADTDIAVCTIEK
ncbi:hypothetical protein KEM54_001688, partial [Ascosphaera aggregata]